MSTGRTMGDLLRRLDDSEIAVLKLKVNPSRQTDSLVTSDEMQAEYDTLLEDYALLKYNCIDTVWRYFPQHCDEFHFLPKVDLKLAENSEYAGGYVFGPVVGRSNTATVRKCSKPSISQSCDFDYAIKIIHKDSVLTIDGVLKVESEVKALMILSSSAGDHQNVMRFVECLHGRKGIYIVTEAVPLDLFEFIKCFHTYIDDNIAAVVISELVCGIGFLCANHISHGDIKPENILVDLRDSQLGIKLCDFGLCNHHAPNNSIVRRPFGGTAGFYAPETLLAGEHCGYKADVFSVGCVAVEMLVSSSDFVSVWLSAYNKAVITSKSYADNFPDINMDFSFDIKAAIETIGAKLQVREAFSSRRCYETLVDIINFHPGCRATLDSLKSTLWLQRSNIDNAVETIRSAIQTKRLESDLNAKHKEKKTDRSMASGISFSPKSFQKSGSHLDESGESTNTSARMGTGSSEPETTIIHPSDCDSTEQVKAHKIKMHTKSIESHSKCTLYVENIVSPGLKTRKYFSNNQKLDFNCAAISSPLVLSGEWSPRKSSQGTPNTDSCSKIKLPQITIKHYLENNSSQPK